MELSSPRFKALAVTLGFSLWFFIISTGLGLFSIEIFVIFVSVIIIITQIFARKLVKVLDAFAIINTKIFLGILFVTVVSAYGIFFKIVKVDLLRVKRQKDTYWLNVEHLDNSNLLKQY
jgi:hypothetical protein